MEKYILLSCTTLFIYLVAWNFQASILLNTDVSWLTLAAKRLLAGGSYATDFFETNPPLIIYLYTPLLLLQHLFNIKVMLALRLYVFFISSLSLFFCYILLKSIINEKNNLIRLILLGTICCVFLISPISEFGQREHLTGILITPYLLLMAARIQNKQFSTKYDIVIGIMAGLGFAIKPYFYLPLILIEIYYTVVTRNINVIFRSETLVIYLVGCLYFTGILLFHYDYLSTIIPLIQHTYYANYSKPIVVLLFNDQSNFWYFLVAFYCLRYRYTEYRQLRNILLISAFGFWLVFLWQQTGWYYHAIPFYTYTILLYALLYSSLITQEKISKSEYFLTGLFSIALFSYYYSHLPFMSESVYYYPSMIMLLCATIFTLLLFISSQQKNGLYFTSATVITLVICTVFYNYLTITIYRPYIFELLLTMIFLNLLLFVPSAKFKYGYLAILGVLIFLYPFYHAAYTLNYSQYTRQSYQHLIDDMKPYTKKRVYFMTSASELVFPLTDYAKLNNVSRFWSLAWLPSIKHTETFQAYEQFYKTHQVEMDFYTQTILSDFAKHQPDIVLVDLRTKGYFFNISPDYIRLFSVNSSFKAKWQNYHLVKILDYKPLYKFAVYSNEPLKG